MKQSSCIHYLTLDATVSDAAVFRGRDTSTVATVDLSSQQGSPKHLASGFIYGIPDTFNQIQSHWYTDIGFNYGRAGGAQEDAPNRGWIWGLSEYYGRLNSTLVDYGTCREYGGDFIILPHDVWGTDQANSSTVWPGDNGDWSDYDAFVKQLMSDLKANDALEGLVWDTWNEPEISFFWQRGQQQWLDLWIRTYKLIRADRDFDGVLISGPTLSSAPSLSSSWWTAWMTQVKGNNTIPDQYAYHLEASPGTESYDLAVTYPTLNSMLTQYGLPIRVHNINEYGSAQEQIPAGAAWWIARLERYNAIGLRGNWRSGNQLHDLMADLLTKPNASDYASTAYLPAPEYPVYRYYNQNMTGVRVATTGSTDYSFDVYATAQAGDKVRILAGSQVAMGNWSISVENVASVGLPASGTLSVHAYMFACQGIYTACLSTDDLGVANYTYSGNVLGIPVTQTANWTAFAFEFDVGSF